MYKDKYATDPQQTDRWFSFETYIFYSKKNIKLFKLKKIEWERASLIFKSKQKKIYRKFEISLLNIHEIRAFKKKSMSEEGKLFYIVYLPSYVHSLSQT